MFSITRLIRFAILLSLFSCEPAFADIGHSRVGAEPLAEPSQRPSESRDADGAAINQLIKVLDEDASRSGVPRIRRDGQGRIVGIVLSKRRATESNIALLRYLSSLEEVDIVCPKPALSEDALEKISGVSSLHRLTLTWATMRVGKKMGLALAGLPHLESVCVQAIAVDSAFTGSLLGSGSVRRLAITLTDSMNDDMAMLIGKAGNRLTELDLSSTDITDDSMTYLSQLASLEHVVLWNTGVTWRGVQLFRSRSKAVVTGVQTGHR